MLLNNTNVIYETIRTVMVWTKNRPGPVA